MKEKIVIIGLLVVSFVWGDISLGRWEVGQYVNYLVEIPGGRWEAYHLTVLEKKGDWNQVRAVILSEYYEISYILEVKDNFADFGKDVRAIGVMPVRGNIPSTVLQQEYRKVYNMFSLALLAKREEQQGNYTNIKMQRWDITSAKKLRIMVKGVGDEETPMEVVMSEQVPLLGLVEQYTPLYGTKVTLTSFGFQMTTDIGRINTNRGQKPDWIDTMELRKRVFPGFSLAVPPSWFFLRGETGEKQGYSLYISFFGGRTHAGFLLIYDYQDTPEVIQTLYEQFLSTGGKKIINHPAFERILSLKEEKKITTVSGEAKCFSYEFIQPGSSGKRDVVALIRSDRKRLLVLDMSFEYVEGYPYEGERQKEKELIEAIVKTVVLE